MKKQKKEKRSFSKSLLVQESILIWIVTLAFTVLAFICVFKGAYADLGWVVSLAALPWTAYGVSQTCYYKKSQKENTAGGIVYDLAMTQQCCKDQSNNEENATDGPVG